ELRVVQRRHRGKKSCANGTIHDAIQQYDRASGGVEVHVIAARRKVARAVEAQIDRTFGALGQPQFHRYAVRHCSAAEADVLIEREPGGRAACFWTTHGSGLAGERLDSIAK